MPKAFYRRNLPHLQADYKPHFLTFCTHKRWILPDWARSIVLQCCLHENHLTLDLKVVVVMPDHVHMIFTPLVNEEASAVGNLFAGTDHYGRKSHSIECCDRQRSLM